MDLRRDDLEKKTVNILGTEYTVETDDGIIKYGADGFCYPYSNKIHIRPIENMLDDDNTKEEKERCYKETLSHECIHAYFRESGLYSYMKDELLVDWIAVQMPKMVKTFRELDIL